MPRFLPFDSLVHRDTGHIVYGFRYDLFPDVDILNPNPNNYVHYRHRNNVPDGFDLGPRIITFRFDNGEVVNDPSRDDVFVRQLTFDRLKCVTQFELCRYVNHLHRPLVRRIMGQEYIYMRKEAEAEDYIAKAMRGDPDGMATRSLPLDYPFLWEESQVMGVPLPDLARSVIKAGLYRRFTLAKTEAIRQSACRDILAASDATRLREIEASFDHARVPNLWADVEARIEEYTRQRWGFV